jgi:hypothetical protein
MTGKQPLEVAVLRKIIMTSILFIAAAAATKAIS